MLDPGVLHPGPQPRPLEFPFAAAHSAIAAINAKIESLVWFRDGHGDSAADVRVGFEGSARDGFDQALGEALVDIDQIRRELETDLDALERLITEARHRIEARTEEIAAWQQKLIAYEAAAMDAARRPSTGARS